MNDNKFCPNCGSKVIDTKQSFNPTNTGDGQIQQGDSDKALKGTLLGVLLTLFFNLLGLILCLILGDESCKNAAIKTFVISLILVVVIPFLLAFFYQFRIGG